MKSSSKPDRGPMLGYLRTSETVSKKDTSAVFRWLASLRLADTDVQLKCADKVIEWSVRHF